MSFTQGSRQGWGQASGKGASLDEGAGKHARRRGLRRVQKQKAQRSGWFFSVPLGACAFVGMRRKPVKDPEHTCWPFRRWPWGGLSLRPGSYKRGVKAF